VNREPRRYSGLRDDVTHQADADRLVGLDDFWSVPCICQHPQLCATLESCPVPRVSLADFSDYPRPRHPASLFPGAVRG
jgi:hypothetical protein